MTCLADLQRPNLGFAAIKLLEAAGCTVEVPLKQTCCGQPAFNSGATKKAARLARQLIRQFEPFDYVVVPSGSCAGMIKMHYAEVLANDPKWLPRAQALAAKTWELMSFLVHVRNFRPKGVTLKATATYHDSCSGLRELGILEQPRALLAAVDGLELKPLRATTCAAASAAPSASSIRPSPTLSSAKRPRPIEATAARSLLLGGDLGCLMNMAGKLQREGSRVRVFHAAEVLAGMGDGPAIGEED